VIEGVRFGKDGEGHVTRLSLDRVDIAPGGVPDAGQGPAPGPLPPLQPRGVALLDGKGPPALRVVADDQAPVLIEKGFEIPREPLLEVERVLVGEHQGAAADRDQASGLRVVEKQQKPLGGLGDQGCGKPPRDGAGSLPAVARKLHGEPVAVILVFAPVDRRRQQGAARRQYHDQDNRRFPHLSSLTRRQPALMQIP